MTTKLKPILAGLLVLSAITIWLAAGWKTTYTPVKATVDVKFGTRSPCLNGGSLCTTELSLGETLSLDARGEMYLEESGSLVFEISKANISVALAQEKLQNGQFAMSESFEMPQEILAAMESSQPDMVIQVGTYPVEETETHYVIRF